MRSKAIVLGAWMLVATFGAAGVIPVAPLAAPAAAAAVAPGGTVDLPVAFEPNQGQTDAAARFVARGPGYVLFFGSAEVTLALDGGAALVRMAFPDAGPATLEPLDALRSVSHYYHGGDTLQSVEAVPQYARLAYRGLWPGIDLLFYSTPDHQVEYDLVLAPGTDPAQVRLGFSGAQPHLTVAGDLVLATTAGDLTHRAPIAYQQGPEGRASVAAQYRLLDAATVGFALGDHDASLGVVIDPILQYNKYFGGSGFTTFSDVAVDGFGSAYVTGYTTALNMPVLNPAQPVRAGYTDMLLAKFDVFGTLVYSTYFGGSQNNTYGEPHHAIAVDAQGNAYAVAATSSRDVPMKDALQPRHAGSWDVVLVKLAADGSLAVSTYFGGRDVELPTGIAIDGQGRVVIGGQTSSDNLPTTNNAVQRSSRYPDTNYYDGFVARYTPALDQLTYVTYYGGSYHDAVKSLALDPAGNIYITGTSDWSNLPRTPGSQAYRLGVEGFVAKIRATGELAYATYLGGYSDDYPQGIAADAAGNAYVAGYTDSTGLDIRGNAFQPLNGGGSYDGFLAKYNPAGTLVYSTYIGGEASDYAYDVAVDAKERAYVTGHANSALTFPLKHGPLDFNRTRVGDLDPFVMKVNTTAASASASLVYSTYYGHTVGADYGLGIAVDAAGNIWAAGRVGPWAYGWLASFVEECGAPPVTLASVAGLQGNAGWWRGDIVVTLTPTSASCPVPYTFSWLDGGPLKQGRTIPVSGDGIHTLVFQSKDLRGGIESNKTLNLSLDATPPVTTPVLTGLNGVGCWYRSQVDVTLVATDATSGVAASPPFPSPTNYSLNGGPEVQRATLSINASRVHDLRYYSFDKAGNREAVKSTSICIDYVKPVVNMTRPSDGNVYVLDVVDPLRPGLPLTAVVGTLEVHADASDDFSGVERVELWVDGNLRGVDHDAPYAFDWKAGDEGLGEHIMRVVAYDMAGNEDVDSRSVVTVPTRHGGIAATLEELTGSLSGPSEPPLPPELRAALVEVLVARVAGQAQATGAPSISTETAGRVN